MDIILYFVISSFFAGVTFSKDDDIVKMTVNENDELILTCPGFSWPCDYMPSDLILSWYHVSVNDQKPNTKVADICYNNGEIIRPGRLQGILESRGTLSEHGIITIDSVEMKDEGLFTCEFQCYPSKQILLTVNVLPEKPRIVTNKDIKENVEVQFSCIVDRVKPFPKLILRMLPHENKVMDNEEQIEDDKIDDIDKDENGVFRIVIRMNILVRSEDIGKQLECIAIGPGYNVSGTMLMEEPNKLSGGILAVIIIVILIVLSLITASIVYCLKKARNTRSQTTQLDRNNKADEGESEELTATSRQEDCISSKKLPEKIKTFLRENFVAIAKALPGQNVKFLDGLVEKGVIDGDFKQELMNEKNEYTASSKLIDHIQNKCSYNMYKSFENVIREQNHGGVWVILSSLK